MIYLVNPAHSYTQNTCDWCKKRFYNAKHWKEDNYSLAIYLDVSHIEPLSWLSILQIWSWIKYSSMYEDVDVTHPHWLDLGEVACQLWDSLKWFATATYALNICQRGIVEPTTTHTSDPRRVVDGHSCSRVSFHSKSHVSKPQGRVFLVWWWLQRGFYMLAESLGAPLLHIWHMLLKHRRTSPG